MLFCSREQLLGLTDRRYGETSIGGLTFRFRNLTEAEKSEFEAAVLSSEGKYSLGKIKRQRRKLICMALVDDRDHQLLRPEDEEQLKAIDGVVTSRLYDAIREHCGFEESDLEELAKNSDAIRADASPCGSSSRSGCRSSTCKGGSSSSIPPSLTSGSPSTD